MEKHSPSTSGTSSPRRIPGQGLSEELRNCILKNILSDMHVPPAYDEVLMVNLKIFTTGLYSPHLISGHEKGAGINHWAAVENSFLVYFWVQIIFL